MLLPSSSGLGFLSIAPAYVEETRAGHLRMGNSSSLAVLETLESELRLYVTARKEAMHLPYNFSAGGI